MKTREEIDRKLKKPRHFLQVSASIIGKHRWPGCNSKRAVRWPRHLKKEIIISPQTLPLEFKRILYEKKGSIAYVTFNRPRVFNALNTALIAELKEASEDCRDDSAVRGVILTGAGGI